MRRDLDLKVGIRCLVAVLATLLVACAPQTPLGEACGERPHDEHVSGPFVPIALDVIVVIDDTPATQPFVGEFADALPIFLRALLSGDHDADGVPETVAVDSLHVGVITGELGGGMRPMEGCEGPGGDARLRVNSTDESCRGVLPGGFLSLSRDDDSSALDALACVARTSGDGCTMSQPLEALLRAVTDPEVHSWDRFGLVPPRFLDASGLELASGHACPPGGGCPHEGFVRPYAQRLAIVLTAGDDCSVADAGVLDPDDPRLAEAPPPMRCAIADRLGLLRGPSRNGDATSVWPPWSLHVIAGVPSDLAVPPGSAPRGVSALADPRMEVRLTSDERSLEPSCVSADGHPATPPRRLVAAVADALAGDASLQSICAREPRAQLLDIASAVVRDWGAQCLPVAPSRPSSAPDECVLFEALPVERTLGCDALPARRLEGRYTDGLRAWELCRIDRVEGAMDERAGWYADQTVECTREPPRLAFTSTFEPVFGASLELHCSAFDTIELRCDEDNDASRPCARGMRCTPGERDRCSSGSTVMAPLRCDPVARTCAIACTTDEDCAAAGAAERRCDRRLVREADAAEFVRALDPIASQTRGVCVTPSCSP